MFLKISRAIDMAKLGLYFPKGKFFKKMSKAAIVYVLCLLMPQNFKMILRELIVRHKVAQFWCKLDPSFPYLEKDFFFVN